MGYKEKRLYMCELSWIWWGISSLNLYGLILFRNYLENKFFRIDREVFTSLVISFIFWSIFSRIALLISQKIQLSLRMNMWTLRSVLAPASANSFAWIMFLIDRCKLSACRWLFCNSVTCSLFFLIQHKTKYCNFKNTHSKICIDYV